MSDRFCTQCGHQLHQGVRFCSQCGTGVGQEPELVIRRKRPSHISATREGIEIRRQGKPVSGEVRRKEKFEYSKELRQLFWVKFAAVPEDVAKVIVSPAAGDILFDIAQKYDIEEKCPDLSAITGAVMVGSVPIQKFTYALEGHLDISEDLARKIAIEVRDRIFAPIASSLRKVHELEGSITRFSWD